MASNGLKRGFWVDREQGTLRQLLIDRFSEVDRNFDTVIDNFEQLADRQVDYFYQADQLRIDQERLDKRFSEILWRLESLERHARLASWIFRQVIFLIVVGSISWLIFAIMMRG